MPNNDANKERELWMRVIKRAQDEADGKYLYTGNIPMLQYLARKWLSIPNRGLFRVCELAGITPQERDKYIIAKARAKYGDKIRLQRVQ